MYEDTTLAAARKKLKHGMDLSYFDRNKNHLIEATLIDTSLFSAHHLKVKNKHDNKVSYAYICSLNVENVDADITPVNDTIRKANVKVGDNVGWFAKKTNKMQFGHIIKLNPKTAKVVQPNGKIYSAPYHTLFFLHDK